MNAFLLLIIAPAVWGTSLPRPPTDMEGKKLGDSCNRAEWCGPMLMCDPAGRCSCSHGLEEDDGDCVPMRQVLPSQPCVRGQQCMNGAQCRNGKCECFYGHTLVNGACEPIAPAKIGARCQRWQQCYNNARCIKGKCTCGGGTELRSGVCASLPPVLPGQKCGDAGPQPIPLSPMENQSGPMEPMMMPPFIPNGRQCLNNAYCMNGVCKCPDGHVLHDGFCRRLGAAEIGRKCQIGQSCKNGALCIMEQNLGAAMSWTLGAGMPPMAGKPDFKCRCVMGTKLDTDGTCQHTKPIKSGGTCEINDVCEGMSFCNKGKCECPPFAKVINGRCEAVMMPPMPDMPVGMAGSGGFAVPAL